VNETFSVLSVGIVLAALVLLLVWRQRRKRTYPEGWVTAEEAKRRQNRVKQKWAKVMKSQGGKLTKEQNTEAFMEMMSAGEMGFVDFKGTRLTIIIPLPIGPIDRCTQFEEPLIQALGDLGVIRGGGSFMQEKEGEMAIQDVDIGVVVKDLDRGLAIIRETLKTQGAPRGTRILQREPVEREFPLYE